MRCNLSTWFRVSRVNCLPVSLLPYTVGALWGLHAGAFRFGAFIAGLAGTGLVHVAANLFNEYWDFRQGADSLMGEYSPHYGGSRSIQEGMVAPSTVRRAAWLCLGSALTAGSVLSVMLMSPLLLGMIIGAAFIAWAYTARPLSLSYRGLGEASLFIAFGPLLVGGGYYLQALRLVPSVFLLSLPSGLLITALLVANETADVRTDSLAGKANLAVRWGADRASVLVGVLLLLAYLVLGTAIACGVFSPAFLFSFLTAPLALQSFLCLRRSISSGAGFRESSAGMFRCFCLYHCSIALIILVA